MKLAGFYIFVIFILYDETQEFLRILSIDETGIFARRLEEGYEQTITAN